MRLAARGSRLRLPAVAAVTASAALVALVGAPGLYRVGGAQPGPGGGGDERATLGSPAAAVFCTTAVADAWLRSDDPTANTGSETDLVISSVSETTGIALLRFDLGALPAEAVVFTASLRLEQIASLPDGGSTILLSVLRRVDGAWDEASVSWLSQPPFSGSYGLSTHLGGSGPRDWDATDLAAGWVSGGAANHGLLVEPVAAPGGDPRSVTYAAREAAPAQPEPRLCIAWNPPTPTFEPPPSKTPSPTWSPTPTASPSPVPSATGGSGGTAEPGTPTATLEPSPTVGPTAGPTDTALTIITVDDDGDSPDSDPGDGACAAAADARCTLRAALMEAHALPPERQVEIRFSGPLTIDVADGGPLPTIRRPGLRISGVDHAGGGPSAGSDVAAQSGIDLAGAPNRETASLAERVVVRGAPAGGAPVIDEPGLSVDGAHAAVIEGLAVEGFSAGILVTGGSSGVRVGSDLDGDLDGDEGNTLSGNRDGLRLDPGVSGASVSLNTSRANLRLGISNGASADGGNSVSRNSLAGNGRGAIGIDALARELPVPAIERVDAAVGNVSGTGCPGCIVELFTDASGQAGRYVDGGTVLVPPDGRWALGGLSLAGADLYASGVQRDDAGNTSRLSEALPLDAREAWKLVSIADDNPYAVSPGGGLVRRYRLVNHRGAPVPNVAISLLPLPDRLRYETAPDGSVEIAIAPEVFAGLPGGQLTASIGAIKTLAGEHRALAWRPRLNAAAGLPDGGPGSPWLDLRWLTDGGVGAVLRRTADSGAGGGSEAVRLFGAAFAAPPPGSVEGGYAWAGAIAGGGGIFDLRVEGGVARGSLEVFAPAEVYGPSDGSPGPAGGCVGMPSGASLAGWLEEESAWVPLPGSSVEPPGAGSATFRLSAPLSLSPGGSAGLDGMRAFTAGRDVEPPSIGLLVTPGAMLSRLPAVIATAGDARSGVMRRSGVVISLDGVSVPAEYDVRSGQVRAASGSGEIPAEVEDGAALLRVEVTDGFCNAAAQETTVIIDRRALPDAYLPIGWR